MMAHLPSYRGLAVLGFAAGLFGAAPATAQSLEVAPISIDLPARRAASVVVLTNHADSTKTYQIRPFAWDQSDGPFHLVPTPDLAISPPFTTLKSGEKQTVRVVLRRPAVGKENSYRLLIDEIPSPAAAGTVQVALRISLPVFAQPATAVKSDLAFQVVRSGRSDLTLILRNQGGHHARLSAVTLAAPGMTMSLAAKSLLYILPGSQISVPVSVSAALPATQKTIRIHATSDQGTIDADAPITSQP